MSNVSEFATKLDEFKHPFFEKAKAIIDAGDKDAMVKNKLPIKLLRLTASAKQGFILTDFPKEVAEAEMLEEYRGGINSFVHISLPDEIIVAIEATKLVCGDCGRTYYTETYVNKEHGVHIDEFLPLDGHCFDCGSRNIIRPASTGSFEDALSEYKKNKEELLGFYEHLGLLVDYDLKSGYEDYSKLKD